MSAILEKQNVSMASGSGNGAGYSTTYATRDPKTGELVDIDIDGGVLQVPTPGFYPVIQLVGITDVFQMANQFKTNDDGSTIMQDMVRGLFRIISPGTPNHKVMFSQLFTFGFENDRGERKISPKSQIGAIFEAIRENPDCGPEFWDVIGGRFGALVQVDKKIGRDGEERQYAKILKDTPVPVQPEQPKAESAPLTEQVKAPRRKVTTLIDDDDE
jgi:hypothetical protein